MPLSPLPSFSRVHGGSKMADFEVKIRSQWQGHPGTLESTWKLLNASNQNYINRKTCIRANLTPAALPSCAWGGGQKWPIFRSESGHNGRVTQGPWTNVETTTSLWFALLVVTHLECRGSAFYTAGPPLAESLHRPKRSKK